MRISILPWALAFSVVAMPALAQESAPLLDTPQECRAAPGESSDGLSPSDQQLEECQGVMTPPPTGDGDIAEPPPEGGKTPVITPPEMPEQQPSN